MTLEGSDYLLPAGWDLPDLHGALAESWRLSETASVHRTRICLDSFDWRLWQAGAELMFERAEEANRLCWVERKSGRRVETLMLDAAPAFPHDLPPGPLRERIADALAMRVLLPLVRVELRQRTLRVLNADDKTVLRLMLLQGRFGAVDGRPRGALETRLRLSPVKGYDKSFSKVRQTLEALPLASASRTLCEEALAGLGRRPGDYSSKLDFQLDPQQRSDETTRHILLSLLDTIERNVAGARANLDSEFLHDLRVATRRSRSAMSQIKGVFEPRELMPFKDGLAWVGQITGPTRDMDVYLLQFDAYRQALPASIRDDLEPFHDFLQRRHAQVQQQLTRKLNSPHFHKLMKQYRQWLEAPLPDHSPQPNALRPIGELANQRIRKMFKRVRRDGSAIVPESPAEAFHELRKDCKKLRYLMEFFQSLYPKPEIRELIKQTKILLDNLGEFQDLQVQAEALEGFGEQMLEDGAPARSLMAMGILVGDLLRRQEQAREAFFELFEQFSTEANVRAFRQLFGGK